MITKEMVEKGYKQGILRLFDASAMAEDGSWHHAVACSVGVGWFYLDSRDAQHSSPEEYKKKRGEEYVVSDIYWTLVGIERKDWMKDSYARYEAFLRENLKDVSIDMGIEENLDNGWRTSDEMVDKALKNITGIGEGQGSGLYGLRDFEVDGERMELVVEICQFENKEMGEAYYGVYYWVGYYGDDSLFTDWEYTSSLDLDELKKLVSDLESRDFTEDIRIKLKKNKTLEGSLEEKIQNAESGKKDFSAEIGGFDLGER